jgi:hypothetical protein
VADDGGIFYIGTENNLYFDNNYVENVNSNNGKFAFFKSSSNNFTIFK